MLLIVSIRLCLWLLVFSWQLTKWDIYMWQKSSSTKTPNKFWCFCCLKILTDEHLVTTFSWDNNTKIPSGYLKFRMMTLCLSVPRAVFHCFDPLRQTILVSSLSYCLTRTSISNLLLGEMVKPFVRLAPLRVKTQTLVLTKFVQIAHKGYFRLVEAVFILVYTADATWSVAMLYNQCQSIARSTAFIQSEIQLLEKMPWNLVYD